MQHIEVKESALVERLLPWQAQGLSYNASGYGRKIPTRWTVKIEGRFRRVYCINYGNSGSLYVVHKGERKYLRFV